MIPSSGGYARSAERFLDAWRRAVGRARLRRDRLSVRAAGGLAVRALASRAGVDVRGRRRQLVPRSRRPVVHGAVRRARRSTTSARGYIARRAWTSAPPKAPARVTGPVRMLLPMFAAEPIAVHFVGAVPRGERKATWNGAPVAAYDEPRGAAPGRAGHGGARGRQRAPARRCPSARRSIASISNRRRSGGRASSCRRARPRR